MSSENSTADAGSVLAKAASAGLQWCEEADAQALAASLSAAISQRLNAAIKLHGKASLVVSGGSTPAPVFAKLSVTPLDWSRVTVTLADERWVAQGHPDSNESLVRDTLLVNDASKARFVSLYRHDCSPEHALQAISDSLVQMAYPFSVVILGMGGDGHTASLFPDAPENELAEAMSLDSDARVAIMHPPSVGQARITLTRQYLLKAEHRFVHITGDQKKAVLSDALTESLSASLDGASFAPYTQGQAPIVGLVTNNMASVSVYWSQ